MPVSRPPIATPKIQPIVASKNTTSSSRAAPISSNIPVTNKKGKDREIEATTAPVTSTVGFSTSDFRKPEPQEINKCMLPISHVELDNAIEDVKNVMNKGFSRLDVKLDVLTKKRNSSSIPLDPIISKNFRQALNLEFRNNKEPTELEVEEFTVNYLGSTEEGLNEIDKGTLPTFQRNGKKRFRDNRGHFRAGMSRNALSYYVNGPPSFPTLDEEIAQDAANIVNTMYKGKIKLTNSDFAYAELILREWIRFGGRLDPNYKLHSDVADDGDDEASTSNSQTLENDEDFEM